MLEYLEMITHRELRQKFYDFWKDKGHVESIPSPLVLFNDATTLFTNSGMQPLVPYLSGESHPAGKRLFNIQPCIRTQDIEEVGDNRHTTFFEMMGNWSLGDYFKKEQIEWKWEFFTDVLELPVDKLFVSIFKGEGHIEKDIEAEELWLSLGIRKDHIFEYGFSKNWWSRAGAPDTMPIGEIGGPSSEIFYDFGTPHNTAFGATCHPNCDCGRFVEIGNSVFMQYKKTESGDLEPLPNRNVDFGGGLERILGAVQNTPDIFKIDLFSGVIQQLEKMFNVEYENELYTAQLRVIADHLRASVFLILDGVEPANKQQGYVLRRLLRRIAVMMWKITKKTDFIIGDVAVEGVLAQYEEIRGISVSKSGTTVKEVISTEMQKFATTLEKGIILLEKSPLINEKTAFDLYQSYGFPFEITQELVREKGIELDTRLYEEEFNTHKQSSRTASAGLFKGGLADHSGQVVKYHTATHLLHQALKDVLGSEVRQEGSNITAERLRFDTFVPSKPTDEQVQQVEEIINQKIKEALPVTFKIMPRQEADALGASSFFREKYGDTVKVYFIGDYSKEFCGGPHVENTSEIGSIKISKVKKIGGNIVRFYLE